MENIVRNVISDDYDEIETYRHLTPKVYFGLSEGLKNLYKGKVNKYTIYTLVKNLDSQIDILKYSRRFNKENIILFINNYFENRLSNCLKENLKVLEAQSS